jgi:hypothetical protein
MEIGLCATAAIGLLFGLKRLGFPWSIASSFCIVNLAAFFGTLKSLGRRGSGSWTPVRS